MFRSLDQLVVHAHISIEIEGESLEAFKLTVVVVDGCACDQ